MLFVFEESFQQNVSTNICSVAVIIAVFRNICLIVSKGTVLGVNKIA